MADVTKKTTQATPGQVSMFQEGGAPLEQNKAIARRFVDEVLNRENLDALNQIMTDDAVLYHPVKDQPVRGVKEIRRMIESYFTAFPDMKVTLDTIVAEGEYVALHVKCRGTQKGAFGDLPATNQKLDWIALNILTIRNGKIVEQRACDNVLAKIEATC